jgi:hypothetical protein
MFFDSPRVQKENKALENELGDLANVKRSLNKVSKSSFEALRSHITMFDI